MTGLICALIFTLLRPGAMKGLSQMWHSSIGYDTAWTIWCAFLAGSYWGALSVAFCLLLDSRNHRKAARVDKSHVQLQPTPASASSTYDRDPNSDTATLRS
jgi:hypothetical protein